MNVLTRLERGQLSGSDLAHDIVVLAKPLEPDRIEQAKAIVARYARNSDSWVRHEVMWFFSWGRCHEYTDLVIERLRSDVDIDNRQYAAQCLGHLWRGTLNREACRALAAVAVNKDEDAAVRTGSYAALLYVALGDEARSVAQKFEWHEKELKDTDEDWARRFLE
jgi:hypothetical protein